MTWGVELFLNLNLECLLICFQRGSQQKVRDWWRTGGCTLNTKCRLQQGGDSTHRSHATPAMRQQVKGWRFNKTVDFRWLWVEEVSGYRQKPSAHRLMFTKRIVNVSSKVSTTHSPNPAFDWFDDVVSIPVSKPCCIVCPDSSGSLQLIMTEVLKRQCSKSKKGHNQVSCKCWT